MQNREGATPVFDTIRASLPEDNEEVLKLLNHVEKSALLAMVSISGMAAIARLVALKLVPEDELKEQFVVLTELINGMHYATEDDINGEGDGWELELGDGGPDLLNPTGEDGLET